MADLEYWKDVVGYEGLYQVSNLGRVKSLERTIQRTTNKQKIKERILSQGLSTTGYKKVVLYKNKNRKNKKVHRLVAEAFIPNTENKRTVNHKNGIKTDNKFSNLEWATYSENMKHAYSNNLNVNSEYQKQQTSLANRGEKCSSAKLAEFDVQVIRDAWATGVFTQRFLSNQFRVGQDQISRIVNNQAWAWL